LPPQRRLQFRDRHRVRRAALGPRENARRSSGVAVIACRAR
jgi:hypothetical protein